ncbi:MAG: glycerol-3-phosphate acyltransferase [Anaerolineales bacterium]
MNNPEILGWLVLIAGYLVGSILPADRIINRKTGKSMQALEENPGVLSAYRRGGLGVGAFVTIFDISKGIIPLTLIDRLGLGGWWLIAAAAVPVVGHNWPIYSCFRGGGKGLATSLGAACWLGWPSILIGLGVGVVLVLWLRWAPAIGLVGLPIGVINMVLAGMNPYRTWAVVTLILLILLAHIPWLIEEFRAWRESGFLPKIKKSW